MDSDSWHPFRASSNSSVSKPGDLFQLSVKGLLWKVGDAIAFSLSGKKIGDLSAGSGLRVDERFRAREQLITNDPDFIFDG